ncbi:hypothetical protein [Nocardioides sp.]|uniref:hypothetical protein n=1 Tax=Nocardioides sp. TaxID=35761 RepID=UPI0035B0FDC7
MELPRLLARPGRSLAAVVAGAALALSGLAPVPAASALASGGIAGVVTDEEAAPLAGIEVTVWDNLGYAEVVVGQDVTGADGSYQVDGITPDPFYKVRFRDPSATYATEWHLDTVAGSFATFVAVPDGGVTTLPDTELEPAGSISGTLTVGAGTPVDNGTVSVWWRYTAGGYSWVDDYATEADGSYLVPGLKSATYALVFRDLESGAAEAWDDRPDITSATSLFVGSGDAVEGIDALLAGVVTNTAAPTITGTPQVGQTLTASSVWTPAGTTVTYRWVVGDDTTPGDDPTGPTYVPGAGDVGKTIRVHATAVRGGGWVGATAWSAATSPVTAVPVPPVVVLAVANDRLPVVKGTLRVGKVIRVTKGAWTPYPEDLDYAWYANGKRIRGAHRQWFKLTNKQLGKRIVVQVTASVPAYQPFTVRTRRTARVTR